MQLPKLDVPTFKHKLTGLDKEITFRRFTIKEQKILLEAKQSADGLEDLDPSVEENAEKIRQAEQEQIDAVKQIISLCTEGTVDPDKLPVFDLEDLFLRIRAKSVSNECQIGFKDKKSGKSVVVKINLDDVKVQTPEGHTRDIMLTDSIGIRLKYPTIDMSVRADKAKSIDDYLKEFVDVVFTEDEIYNFSDFTDDQVNDWLESIDSTMAKKIQDDFFNKMPKLRHEVKVKLDDGETETLVFEGLQSFFS